MTAANGRVEAALGALGAIAQALGGKAGRASTRYVSTDAKSAQQITAAAHSLVL